MDSIFDKVEDKLPLIQERIARLSFINASNLNYSNHEGYFARCFGYRTGPALAFEFLAHEMGHAIDHFLTGRHKKLLQDSWGLRIKSYQDVMGTRYFEPVTMKPTELECRVVGYQKHLMELAGDPASETLDEDMAQCLLDFMPDFWKGGNNHEEKLQTRLDLIKKSYNSIKKSDIPDIWANVGRIIYNN